MPESDLADFPQETNIQDALKNHKPDAVIVSNPTAFHLDVAIPAAEAGCHLLLEKPLSHSMSRLDELQSAAQKSGSKILVGFQFRFHPGLVKAKELISKGELGRPISAQVHFGEYLPAWHPWEDYRKSYVARADMGGGVVLTQCHSLDYLPWLIGDVKDIWGLTAKLSDLEVDVEDTAEIGFRFNNGTLGSVHLDFNQQPPEHHFTIVGTKGTLKWNLVDGGVTIYRLPERSSGTDGEWQSYPIPESWERNTMFMDQMKHFVDVVRGNVDPTCTLKDGIRNMKIIQAVHKSNSDGRIVSFND